jgi:hypothetical protein
MFGRALVIWRRIGDRLGRKLGYRGAFLASLANFDLIWAWSLFDPADARALRVAPTYRVVVASGRLLSAEHPLWPWMILTATVGVMCGVMAWMKEDRLAFAVAISLKLLWAMYILASWPVAHLQVVRPTLIFLTLASIVSICAAGLPVRRE